MTYHVTGTDMYGCVNMDSVTVTLNSLPTVALSGPTMACDLDAAFTLVGTPAGGTFSGPGVTGNQFDPSVATAGTHTLIYTYTDSLGCVGSDSISVTVDLCLSVTGNEGSQIQVMPNPFSDQLILGLQNSGLVRIYNSLGQIVFEQEMNAGRSEINTTQFATGIYFLEVQAAAGKEIIRIVKSN